MNPLKLYMGNKNYSSWSFRPWIGLKVKGIPFEELLRPFNEHGGNPQFLEFSPTGLVPVLVDGDLTVWESLSILEYIAEKFPDRNLWPEASKARARARSISHEMHAGFRALRSSCPMNMRRKPSRLDVSADTRKDIARVEQIWGGCLQASGGPFLFGEFTIADAMYAPVVNRFGIYELSTEPFVAQYTDAMTALPAWQEWKNASEAEPWRVEHDEV